MTIPQLQAFARASLDFAVNCIRETGQLHQQFHLIPHNGDGPHKVMIADGSITNDPHALHAFFNVVRERARLDNAEAVVMISDVFMTEGMTDEQAREKARLGLNVEEAAKAGITEKHEAVMVVLESPIYQQILRQKYRRNPPESTNVELVGAPEIDDSTSYLTNFHFFSTHRTIDTTLDELFEIRRSRMAKKETVQ